MEGEGHPGTRQVVPKWLVRKVIDGRRAGDLLGPTPDAAKAELLDAAAGLTECVARISHRQHADPDQALAVGPAVLGHPVVDGAAERERRLPLGDALDHQAVGRIDRRGGDGVDVHVGQPGHRVVRA